MALGDAMQSLMISAFDLLRYCRGFHGKSVRADDFEWSFMERDAAPSSLERQQKLAALTEPVVFVHGFSSGKESWTNLASQIDKKYQIVVPDLPGQGRTTPADPTLSYTMDDQARRLHKFLEATIPADRKVHLVGCSMGGMLAGVYSATYPERVRSLTMICPAGITMPTKSEAYKLLDDEGKNVLLAETTDDFMDMVAFIVFKPVKLPRFLASVIVDFRAPQLPVFEKILSDALTDRTILEDRLHLITAKTLVFWGKNDRILDVSSLPILEKKLTNVPQRFTFVFDECGHTVQHEKVDECARAINLFLDGETPEVETSGR